MPNNPDAICKEFAVLIPLTNGGHAMIDLEDYDRVMKLTWYRCKGYVRHVFNDNTVVWLHRLILGLETYDPRQTDHKNRNKLDNRRDNLRIATIQQNAVNRMPARPRLYRGVRYVAPRRAGSRAWYARAGLVYLGSFFTAEEAARAYDAKALELYGEFAILNFPQEHQHE